MGFEFCLILERKVSFSVVRSDGSMNLNLGGSNARARRVDRLITNAVAVNLLSSYFKFVLQVCSCL
jgi:hypothetical protein